jgi:TPR repeat protein
MALCGVSAASARDDALLARAEAGDVEAQFQLARRYLTGQGMPKDPAAAAEWLQKAAEQGDARAQVNLAAAYAQGRGVTRDDAAAVNWLMRAAQQKHPRAMYELGERFMNGQGVPQSLVVAHMWMERAASAGSPAGRFGARELARRLDADELKASRRLGLRARAVSQATPGSGPIP